MSKPFVWQELFVQSKDSTEYELLSNQHVTVTELDGEEVIKVAPEALTLLAQQAFYEASFFLRAGHLKQIASILHDPQASSNDKYVALQLLRNAEVSAKGVLPNCQDTGTATIVASKGQHVWTGGDDAEALSKGVYTTFTENNLRYSQNAPLDMYTEVNTQTNLPAQIDISATPGNEYRFLFVNKGGGSANKAALFQETKSILQPEKLTAFLIEKMKSLGTAACPPYHIAFVVGGLSADQTLKVAKLASTKYYDNLPTSGNELGQAFRDTALEAELLNASREFGIGAQFGGKYFAHDIRVIRLPRHGASCPVGMGVSCSADRNIKAKINRDGIWIEKLESNPGKYIPEHLRQAGEGEVVSINLNQPMSEILAQLSQYPVSTRLSLSGTIIVARDIAHAKLKELIDNGEALPQYFTLKSMFLGTMPGCLGEVSALALLIGGVYLLCRKVITWHIPVSFIGTVALLTLIFGSKNGGGYTHVEWMLDNLLSGGLLLGAFFMATDYSTSPVTAPGRIIYGIGCGALTVLIRVFGGFPEGVSFAILIMNCCAWMFDKHTQRRQFGVSREDVKAKKAAAKAAKKEAKEAAANG